VISKDGTRIGCLVEGRGDPLLLVHGTSADATRWGPVMPALAERFTVHAMHRRGRGTSADSRDDGDYSVAREAEDIAAVVDALVGLGPVKVVGHSYGALSSLEALLHSTNIEALVVYEPPVPTGTPVYPAGTAEDLEARLAAGDREGVVESFFRRILGMNDAELANVRALPSWQGRVEAAHTLAREVRATDRYVWDRARFIDVGRKVPLTLLIGGASHPIARAMSELVAESFVRHRLVELAGQKHVAMDTAPDVFVREVLAAFDQQTAA
jgi:pimeloyl-ACP methyl ester carboxylesterase